MNNLRCQFDVTIQDDTGSATTIILEKMEKSCLCLTAAEIYNIRCPKNQLLPLLLVQHKLLKKIFTLQMKKLYVKNQDTSSAKLFIMSIIDKDISNNSSMSIATATTPESSKRKPK